MKKVFRVFVIVLVQYVHIKSKPIKIKFVIMWYISIITKGTNESNRLNKRISSFREGKIITQLYIRKTSFVTQRLPSCSNRIESNRRSIEFKKKNKQTKTKQTVIYFTNGKKKRIRKRKRKKKKNNDRRGSRQYY
jgi:hypothetical protein